MNVPDLFEAITAYRAWGVYPNGLLVGQAHPAPWPPYEPMRAFCAACSRRGGALKHLLDGVYVSAPVAHCYCGIYALKHAEIARQRTGESIGPALYNFLPFEGSVWGPVKLWGKVIEHEAGYRAEYAYPIELRGVDEQLVKRAAALYGVPYQLEKSSELEADWGSYYLPSTIIVPLSLKRLAGALFSPSAAQARYLGLLTDLDTDIKEKPAIHKPASPIPVLPHIVGATRWQIRQYTGQLTPRQVELADWREILRRGFYAGVVRTPTS